MEDRKVAVIGASDNTGGAVARAIAALEESGMSLVETGKIAELDELNIGGSGKQPTKFCKSSLDKAPVAKPETEVRILSYKLQKFFNILKYGYKW
jgi:hypothetical protein